MGRAEEAEAVLAAAEAMLDAPRLRDGLTALRATFLVFAGRLKEALELAQPLLAAGDVAAYVHGALPVATALALGGHTVDAIAVADRGATTRAAMGDDPQFATAGVFLVAHAQALLEGGRMDEGLTLARLGYDASLDIGAPQGQAWFASILARIELHRGRAESAARWGHESGLVFREVRHPSARWGFGAMACARAMVGDREGAAAAYAEIDAEPPTPVQVFDPEIARGRAWMAAHSGERSEARAILRVAGETAEAGGAYAIAAGAFHDLARLGEPAAALAELERIAPNCDSPYIAARCAHARALARQDGDALDAAAATFESMGALLLAAEAAAAAAPLHGRAAMRRKATASSRQAATLLARCEGAVPFVAVPDLPGIGLTPREREIAELAAQELTSREIAERLVLSARTVENHLQRAYEKLGVRGRRELRDALAQQVEAG
jgi:DNA-binding CsgD family transcriptional regulator